MEGHRTHTTQMKLRKDLAHWPEGPGRERHSLVSSLLCCPHRGLGFRCPPLKMEKEQLPRTGGQ